MTIKIRSDEERLVEKFVGSFSKFDEIIVIEGLDPVAWELRLGKPGKCGAPWRPRNIITSQDALVDLYQKLPARFPPLYEKLVLSYRWAEVELGQMRLLANPRGPGLQRLFMEMTRDAFLSTFLHSNGFVQFGRGSGGNYDPVCFQISSRHGNHEYKILRLDHEEILCNERIVVVEQIAPNYRQLVLDVIESEGFRTASQ